MNRKKGLALTASGVILVLITVLGVFAVANDSADTGALSLETAAKNAALDLQISTNTFNPPVDIFTAVGCGSVSLWSENQATTDILTITGASPGASQQKAICLRNTGDETLHLSASLVASTNTETGCTGDEPSVDPDGATCGSTGELADDVNVTVQGGTGSSPGTCDIFDALAGPTFNGVINDATPVPTGLTIAPGGRRCMRLTTTYLAATPIAESVENQTDKVTFQIRFHGELS